MREHEMIYAYSSVGIALALFVAMIIANEAAFRAGRFVQAKTDDEVKALTGSIQASILGLLALLLGFTFNMSMQRFDSRNMALIDEANAINTAILRAQFLPEAYRDNAEDMLQEYVKLRITIGDVDLTKSEERQQYNQQITHLQNKLWQLTVAALEADPRSLSTGNFVNALNTIIDREGKRNALLKIHVPEVVLFLLFVVFLSSGGILGYSAGLSGKRVGAPIVLVSLLITLIVFIIIDLDRPKRGLIQVDQKIMSELLNRE